MLSEIIANDFPQPKREVLFFPGRRWRFDFAWQEYKLAVEVDGGVWVGGRHVTGRGYEADCEKFNFAALSGWTVFHFTPKMIADGRAIAIIRLWMEKQGLINKDE